MTCVETAASKTASANASAVASPSKMSTRSPSPAAAIRFEAIEFMAELMSTATIRPVAPTSCASSRVRNPGPEPRSRIDSPADARSDRRNSSR